MKKIRIKVIVNKDVTACSQMRVKHKDSKWTDFCCGVDLVGHLVVANCPPVYGHTFLELAKEVAKVKHFMSQNFICSEFENLDNVESIHFYDDSYALVKVSDEDSAEYYLEEKDRIYKKQKEKLSKYKDRLLMDTTLDEETGDWRGCIEICVQ